VVVSLGGGYFDPREVKTGVVADGYVQILEGIEEGETVVTSSQFLIDSESNLRAAIDEMADHGGHDMFDSGEKGKQGSVNDTTVRHIEPMQTKKQVYTCEMHPEIISDKPGECPKCGMTLILKKESR
jgi:hypothetical protein